MGFGLPVLEKPSGYSHLIKAFSTPSTYKAIGCVEFVVVAKLSAKQKRSHPKTAEAVDHTIQLLNALDHEQNISIAMERHL